MISERPTPDALAQYFKSADLVPPTFTQSIFNSVKEGINTGPEVLNVIHSAVTGNNPNEDIQGLWDSINIQNQRESELLSIPQKIKRYPLEFLGNALGMAFNPLTAPFTAVGGLATEGISRLALSATPKIAALARTPITAFAGTELEKYLPQSVGQLAKTVSHGTLGFAGFSVPQSVIDNYNADTKSINWGGATEEVAINGAMGAFLSIPGYAAGVAFRRILDPEEKVPMPETEEAKGMPERLAKALAEKRITQDEYDYGKMLYEDPHNPELQQKATDLMIKKGQPVDSSKLKAFFSMVDENEWNNLKNVFAEQLNNAEEFPDKKALSDFIFRNSLDKLRDQPEHIDGLHGVKAELDNKLADKERKLKEADDIVNQHLHTGLQERMPFDQHDIYEQVKNNPTEHLPYTIPEDVKNKIRNEEINLKSPQEELDHIKNKLLTEKGLPKNWDRTKEYGRLVDLADVWHNAQTLLDRVNLEADYNRSNAYRNLIGNYLKVLDSQIEKFADSGRVQDYLKTKIDKAAGLDDEYKYSSSETKENIEEYGKEPSETESILKDLNDDVERIQPQKELGRDYKETTKRYKQFKKSAEALAKMMDCLGAKK